MYPNLDAHALPLGIIHVLFFTDGPSISAQLRSGLNDHVPH